MGVLDIQIGVKYVQTTLIIRGHQNTSTYDKKPILLVALSPCLAFNLYTTIIKLTTYGASEGRERERARSAL